VVAHSSGCFHQQLGRFEAFPAGLFKNLGELAPALEFIEYVVASGEPAQTVDERVPICQTVGAHAIGYARRQDLLGPPAADPQEKLNGGAVHERAGQGAQFLDNVV
jgi:hypothetical protein